VKLRQSGKKRRKVPVTEEAALKISDCENIEKSACVGRLFYVFAAKDNRHHFPPVL